MKHQEMSRDSIEALSALSMSFSSGVVTECFGGKFKLYLDSADKSLTPSIRQLGYWESWVSSWVTRNLHMGDTFIDFGANVGYYSMLAGWLGAGEIYAAEPMSDAAALIAVSAKENNYDIEVWPYAFGNENKTGHKLYTFGDLKGSTSGKFESDTYVTAPMLKTDDHLAFLRIDSEPEHLWKIDVEGAEEELLLGAEKSLSIYKPTLLLEWTPNAYSDAFFGFLSDYGKVSLVNYQGDEQDVTEAILNGSADWQTVAVHPHD